MEWSLELEEYITAHSEQESEVLAALRRATHLNVMRPRMLSGNMQGQLLKMFCRMIGARRVLEIGTYTGYAAISLAEGLEEDGIVYTIDINDEIEDIAREYIRKSGLEERIRFLLGDACDLIPDLAETFDLVFIDADKRQYPEYYRLIFDKLKPGGIIVADDVLWEGKVLTDKDAQTRGIMAFNDLVAGDERVEKLILPVRHGLMLIRKK
ncbi:O-methyltransferase [Culturomica massiliensis]|uniref:O-methyltransferase n=1 Tax=Culturomica massiliensis TaxID=1841857 RepID=UPI0026656EA7|nr:O-methyltransferase [Culturomica massiliensis]